MRPREAVVDGELRLTYAQFFERCDARPPRSPSSALARVTVSHHRADTAAHLEQFYAVPQLGAVVVPLNYRLIAEDFAISHHSGAAWSARHSLSGLVEHPGALPKVEHFVALEREDRLAELRVAARRRPARNPAGGSRRERLARHQLHERYDAKPKGVMITHRYAWVNAVGTLIHHPMSTADRYLVDAADVHANGWTFVWVVTAAGRHPRCLRKVEPAAVYERASRASASPCSARARRC